MAGDTTYLLALNCGSSSVKSTLFEYPSLTQLASISASSIGTDGAKLKIKTADGKVNKERSAKGETHADVFGDVLKAVEDELHYVDRNEQIKIVTHRIVHGGKFHDPVLVTKDQQEALQQMEELSSFAPLHNHHAVLTVHAVLDKLPQAKNLLCFDTLFHRSIPPHIYTYPIEQPDHEPPVPLRRYGFHGLSYASILKNVAEFLQKPADQTSLIICHLGSGASMACVKDGKSLDTTMGLTPLEGLPGGTRSGSLDPSLVFHLYPDPSKSGELQETKGMKIGLGELMLNKSSGFQGLCGTSEFGDIIKKAGEQISSGLLPDPPKKQAMERLTVELFENRILNFIGSYLVHLKGRPDAIVFSGGIGEKSVELRRDILQALDYLGVEVDDQRNKAASGEQKDETVVQITSNASRLRALRVLTDEEKQCAEMAKSEFGDKL